MKSKKSSTLAVPAPESVTPQKRPAETEAAESVTANGGNEQISKGQMKKKLKLAKKAEVRSDLHQSL